MARPILRIQSGKARGRRIFAPKGRDVRPCPGRVRTAIFNMLRKRLKDSRILDIFAGTGSIGLEGVSRGAGFSLFVEKSESSHRALQRNIDHLRFGDQCEVYRGDAFRCAYALAQMYEPFDIIVLDPPHALWRTKKRPLLDLIGQLREYGTAREGAAWVLGHPRTAPYREDLEFLGPLDRRGYGEAHLTLVR